ncbi:DNA (cytosine-5)-methyltransferase 3B isoform X1 [Nasonia vitripennis]|uniref:DNA (cytosine-5-)-methyltransferase n=1 Tax=Nasonia vitripennis TaxID=7425 RepID=A0A7M7H8M1_NASVI|nr:DNA (cytosine-5)-methyltransferase 3B isoform X1 [Nasonia vitripennis]
MPVDGTNLGDDDLMSIHQKISHGSYWSGSLWREMMAMDLFVDHNYCKLNKSNVKIDKAENYDNFNISQENILAYKINNNELMEFDIQNYVEIQCNDEMQNDISEDVINFNSINTNTENRYFNNDATRLNCNEIAKDVNFINTLEDMNFNNISNVINNSIATENEHSMNDSMANSGSQCLINNLPLNNHNSTFTSYSTEDSGIESMDSLLFTESEDSFLLDSRDDHCYSFSKERDGAKKSYFNKRKAESSSAASISTNIENSDVIKDKSEVPAKRNRTTKRSREVIISEESPIIEGKYEESRRVTRLLVKNSDEKPVKYIDNTPGKLVWGYFRSGWWPDLNIVTALIIRAEDAGMIPSSEKIWVSWIGESRISELNAKCIDKFSNHLERRLDNLATNSKTKVTCKKQKDEACFKTIQLLKKHFTGGALVKPYIAWIKNNILPYKNKLDELHFYPYPESLSDKLNNLKIVNSEKNEKYLRQQEKERLCKAFEPKNLIKKIEKFEKPIEKGGINIVDQKYGMIVWAKMQGYSWWPCVIMDYQHLNRKQPHVAHQWVMWYGDYKYSQVQYRQILTFPTGMDRMESKITATKDELFCKAVLQAAKDYCDKLGYLTEPWKIKDVIHLFYKSKDIYKLKNAELTEPNEEDLYSQTIKKQLRKQINNQPISEERKKKILECKNLNLLLSGKLPLESLCISCLESGEELEDHPFFHASMCEKCLEDFSPKIFAYGNDAKCFYCTLCGGDDLVAVCDSMSCPRVFCTACIKYIICPEFYEDILLKHPWYCFLCDPSSISTNNVVIKIRNDWRYKMISLYRINCDEEAPSNLERLDRNRKIRVLSLFDGIGTGLVVLKHLNVNIECYYASEIDPDSMQVSFFNHGNEIIQLGDVRNIDEKKIKEIAPIDLLIGGSPCNELSLANPKRRGLDDPEGTGILFYDYVRIMKLVKKHNKKRHLFWLFENVASMPKKFRNQISKNLGREPKFLDSADFSAQHRPRLYWGNLPWGPYQVNNVVLQDVLRKRCNRQALVKKIMTVTTRTNSLNQTKENLKPVLMDGKKDMLWVTELEKIFGFPMHYTDTNLQKTRRLQLIGKAWSVQTLTAILRPVFLF